MAVTDGPGSARDAGCRPRWLASQPRIRIMTKPIALTLAAVVLSIALVAFAEEAADEKPVPAPPGAIVLFAGQDAAQWTDMQGGPCPWKIENGYLETAPGKGSIITKDKYQDFTLHVEFWLPKLPDDVKGQARANSGVYEQGRYEVQVLDSYGLKAQNNDCGAIYGVKAPNVNAARPPEHWQTYDITFRAPRFDAAGKKTQNARFVKGVWNGQVIHENVDCPGPTTAAPFPESAQPGPIYLQDHGNRVRYRNLWIVPEPGAAKNN
jgi:hypothetical protein